MFERSWDDGLVIRSLTTDEYDQYISQEHHRIFAVESPRFDADSFYTDETKDKLKVLRDGFKVYRLILGAFLNGTFVGWHFGRQDTPDAYYMTNSAVLPEYRRQKIYQRLLEATLEAIVEAGFQCVTSNHHPSNNAVIIPKLKLGFWISGMRITDAFGTIVSLTWFPHQVRRDAFEYRTGYTYPTKNLAHLAKIVE